MFVATGPQSLEHGFGLEHSEAKLAYETGGDQRQSLVPLRVYRPAFQV